MFTKQAISGLIALTTVLGGAAATQASLIAYEEFNYTTDSALNGKNGGTLSVAGSNGFSNAWSANDARAVIKDSPAYTYGAMQQPGVPSGSGNGGHYSIITSDYRTDVTRSFIDTTGSGTSIRYYSMLVKQGQDVVMWRNGSGSSTWSFGIKNGAVFIGSGYDGAFSGGSATGFSSTAIHLLVLKVDNSGTNTVLSLYADPSNLASQPVTPTVTITMGSKATMSNQVALAGKNVQGNGGGGWDSLHIGTTWADVVPVPEPASIALLGLAGLLMLPRRSKKA